MAQKLDAFLGIRSTRLTENVAWLLGQFDSYTVPLRHRFRFPSESGLTIAIDDRRRVNASASWDADSKSFVISFLLGLIVWAYELAVDI